MVDVIRGLSSLCSSLMFLDVNDGRSTAHLTQLVSLQGAHIFNGNTLHTNYY